MRIADIDIQKVYEDLYNKAGLWAPDIHCIFFYLIKLLSLILCLHYKILINDNIIDMDK